MSTKHNTNDYEMIRKWGETLGSARHYILAQQVTASVDGAPVHAIYKRDGVWYTTDDITSATTRERLGLSKRRGDA